MTLLANINVGSSPNDGSGDSLRTSFTKCNDNFQILDELATQFVAGNLNTNVISTGTSTFNNVTANLFSGNGSGLYSVNASTSGLATYVTGNTQANITTVGTLGNLTVSGTILSGTIEGATIGNTGASLVGTITTAAQPNITSLGVLTQLNMAPGFISNIGSVTYAINNELSTVLTSANVRFDTSRAIHDIFSANANVTLSYASPITLGMVKHVFIKNTKGSTIYVNLPNTNNNKASNSISLAAGTVGTFIFTSIDTTSANVVGTIISN